PRVLRADVQLRVLGEAPGVDVAVGGDTIVIVPSRGAESGSASLGWMDRSGRFTTLGAPSLAYRHLDLSRDGTKIATGVDGNRDIYLYDVPRDVSTRFTTAPEEDETPRWSPDGKRVVWAAARNGREHVMVAPADGGAPEQSLWSTSDHVHINGW